MILNAPMDGCSSSKKEVNIIQQSASRGGASAEVYLAEKWQEHMIPIITQYGLKGHSQTGQNIAFYNAQPTRTLVLKGEKYQDRKGYEDTVAVFDISMLMAAKIIIH